MQYTSRLKYLSLLGAILILVIGCSKKPAPIADKEPEPPKMEATKEPTSTPTPSGPSEEELRRQRIQARIAETFKPIYFNYDQSALSPESKKTLEAIGQLMKEVKEITSRVEGHADERGTNEYNLALGERRAKAVQDYLSSYGVEATRLSTISYGEEKPASDAHDDAAWGKNRRAEFTTTF